MANTFHIRHKTCLVIYCFYIQISITLSLSSLPSLTYETITMEHTFALKKILLNKHMCYKQDMNQQTLVCQQVQQQLILLSV